MTSFTRNITFKVPFVASLNAYKVTGSNREYVILSRDDKHFPFCVYDLMPSGWCEAGGYYATRTEAFADFDSRQR